jgi:predicted metal-dependent hydrolase
MSASTAIIVREPTFAHERGPGGIWNPRLPELSHTLNGFQLALPYLEPYFIDAVRSAKDYIKDARLSDEVRAFCSQEAHHARRHRDYGRVLRKRYPRLAEFETKLQQYLVHSRRNDPLTWRVAYTAGYEAITAQLSRWLFRSSEEWFHGADPEFAAMMTWHAAEEIEHRHVAYDVLRAVSTSYPLRARALFAAVARTWLDLTPVVTYMLEVDGYSRLLSSRARRWRLRLRFVGELVPAIVRYITPGYHPLQERAPAGYDAWLRDNAPVPRSEREVAQVALSPTHGL